MHNFYSNVPELLVLLFIAITFLQSGLDKVFDWKGNTGWLHGHFEKTFLRGIVPLMVGVILVLEIISGALACIGVLFLLFGSNAILGLWAMILAAITLLMLLFGQRIAKDYPGAFTITGYFIVVLFGIFLITS